MQLEQKVSQEGQLAATVWDGGMGQTALFARVRELTISEEGLGCHQTNVGGDIIQVAEGIP